MMKKMISDVSTVLSICRRPTTSRPPSVTETCGLTTFRTKRWFTEADFALGHFHFITVVQPQSGSFQKNVHRPSIQRTSPEDKFPTKSGGRDRWPIHFPVLLETYFSTWAKMQTSKRKLKSTTQDVSNVNGCKRKINEKCEFWILQISSSLFFLSSKTLSQIMIVGTKWKRIQIFYEGNDITQILASFPPLCNWTAPLWTGSGHHASAIIPTSTKMQSAPLRAWKWSLHRAWGFP